MARETFAAAVQGTTAIIKSDTITLCPISPNLSEESAVEFAHVSKRSRRQIEVETTDA